VQTAVPLQPETREGEDAVTDSSPPGALRFKLDKARARAWIENGNGLDGELAEAGQNWDPHEDGTYIDVYNLIDDATKAGIIICPAGMDVAFEYDETASYRFLVDIGPHITLASTASEMSQLGEEGTTGADAAVAILVQAAAEANHMLYHLDEYIAQRAAGAVPGRSRAAATAGMPADPCLDADDEAVTRAHRHLRGDLDAGLMPGIELGGVQVTAWREAGALQVDVNLEDAIVTAWKLDGSNLDVHLTVAGVTEYRGGRGLPGACIRCGGPADDGEGWDGLCGTCADQDYAAERAAEAGQRRGRGVTATD
jgi:hypothetical protein